MNEQEIVQYLKDNRTKGVACGFMPRAVLKWVKQHMNILEYYVSTEIFLNGWVEYNSKRNASLKQTDIVALPEDFKLEEKPDAEWVDFDVDLTGHFHIKIGTTTYTFHWLEYLRAILTCECNKDENMCLTAFGGWLYKDDGDYRWHLKPTVQLKDGTIWNSYVVDESEETKPAIPVKIRFWRVNKND